MYASDIINRNRSSTLYINSVLKKQEFSSGKSIRIDTQKGGVDYQYMSHLDLGYVIEQPIYNQYIPISIVIGKNPNIFPGYTLNRINIGLRDTNNNFLIYDSGYNGGLTYEGGRIIDDGSIPIPTGGMDFYFFGTNYGATNTIHWNTNNAITFGALSGRHLVSLSKNTIPAILLGNYDRITSAIYSSTYFTQGDLFRVTAITVYFSNYYTDTTNLDAGKYQIRLIRELYGNNRQWVEVSIISSVSSPGYSNNNSITYPSGTIKDPNGNTVNQDSDGYAIDPTKNSPYDITNGTSFLNLIGTRFSTVSPQAGTNFLYQSNNTGDSWNFIDNAYLPL